MLSISVKSENSIESRIASNRLFDFPWELLHYQQQFLLAQASVRIRRNNTPSQIIPVLPPQKKLRILTLSPRPLEAGFIDHRASLKPLLEAVDNLNQQLELVQITATKEALEHVLQQAKVDNKPFHLLHFDGHGGYDYQKGKGFLCFEHHDDKVLPPQVVKRVYADDLAKLLAAYCIPLVFLDACQTGKNEASPNASLASSLLQAGIPSVIAMTHSVLVETSCRFVGTLYSALATGQTISNAVIKAQQALQQSSERIMIAGAGRLHLQDWFVPVLYQQQDQALLIHQEVNNAVKYDLLRGNLPANPKHGFVGRSFELFHLERLLKSFDSAQGKQPYIVIRGQGGMGKTTIAIELAYWLVQSRQFDRCAFVSLEAYSHDRSVLDVLGKQLVDKHYSVAEYPDLKKALQPIHRVLENNSCLLVLDNMESLLVDTDNLQPVLTLVNDILASDTKTRLIFTTRESLPAPFDSQPREITLGELNKDDARQLIMNVMAEQGLTLQHDDQGRTPEEVDALITAVNGHARALVLLSKELSSQGITATTENLQAIMLKLEQQHPGEREYSLFASLELSLQRLSTGTRELIKGLAVLHDGGEVELIARILGLKNEEATLICIELIHIGLAELKKDTYLRLDPALPNYLNLLLPKNQKQYYQQRWFEALSHLVSFLSEQKFKDPELHATLTQLELPNLIGFIQHLCQQFQTQQIEAKMIISQIGYIEELLECLDSPNELTKLIVIRHQIKKQLGKWSSTHFTIERLSINRLLDQGNFQRASQVAKNLLQSCEQAGVGAYLAADFDLLLAFKKRG